MLQHNNNINIKNTHARTHPCAQVTGLALVSCGLSGDLEQLGPIFGRFEHLESLLIQNNPLTGDIRHLRFVFVWMCVRACQVPVCQCARMCAEKRAREPAVATFRPNCSCSRFCP